MEWGIKKMKTRWGTCNVDVRRIWLNLELAKKPPQCLEYLVVHEMLHLLERRHTDRYPFIHGSILPPLAVMSCGVEPFPAGARGMAILTAPSFGVVYCHLSITPTRIFDFGAAHVAPLSH